MNVVGLSYQIVVPGRTVGLASTTPGVINLMSFKFASSGDYATFDQDATEATIKTVITACATGWASLLGITVGMIQAGLVVNRTWVFAAADFASNQVLHTDQMTYP